MAVEVFGMLADATRVRSIGRRLLDAIEPELVARLEYALAETPGVVGVTRVRLRWAGHRLHGGATLVVEPSSLEEALRIMSVAQERARAHVPSLDELELQLAVPSSAGRLHAPGGQHRPVPLFHQRRATP